MEPLTDRYTTPSADYRAPTPASGSAAADRLRAAVDHTPTPNDSPAQPFGLGVPLAARRPPLQPTLVGTALPSWPELWHALTKLDAHVRAHAPGNIDRPTPYHSSAVPPTPLVDFAHFICARTRYDVAGLAIAVALLARRSAAGRPLCALSMHRVLLACIVVGAKANFDRFIRNDHVAGLCGVELSELNFLEATLLDELDWRVMPTANDLATAPEVLRRLALVQA